MKRAVAVIFLLSIVIMLAGAQQQEYTSIVLEFDLAQATAVDIQARLNSYLRYGYMVVSASIYGNTFIVILQARIK